jgi:CheY-like chemotaxis protein
VAGRRGTPNVKDLNERTRGEVLLRTGAISGWLGSTKQIEGSQEKAKNLISESISVFESLPDLKRAAEAHTEIAVCYGREGALDEARTWLRQARSRLDQQDGDLMALALLRSAIVEKLANRLSDALTIFTNAAPLFEASANHTLTGRFHHEFANVLRRLSAIENCNDYLDRAVIEYTAASFHFEAAGHTRYQACVENNLAIVYLQTSRLSEAHEHLDRAQALFTRLHDNVHLAQVEDTRARVMLAEGAFVQAEKSARRAVQLLENGDELSLLAEALTTLGLTVCRLHDNDQARGLFERAVGVAERIGDLEGAGLAALTIFEQLAEHLSDDEICEVLGRARELLVSSQNARTRDRLTDCAFRALSFIHTFRPDWSTFSLDQTLHRHQARYIQMALEDASGNKSRAARLLGLSAHQNLLYMLKNPHKNLGNITSISAQDVIPDDTASGHMNQVPQLEKKRAVRILHVEDDLTVAELVREMAEKEGWTITHRIEGNAALDELASEADYDLLLVDHDLPVLSGVEVMERVRSMLHRRYMPVVMMSGTLDEARAREAGADAFLHKPEGIRSLVGTITRLLDEREQEA